MIHTEPHPDAGTFVKLGNLAKDTVNNAVVPGADAYVIDYYDRVKKCGWSDDRGDEVALAYAWRAGFEGIVPDDEVVLAEIHGARHVVHVTEIDGLVGAELVPA